MIEELQDGHARRNELTSDMIIGGLLELAQYADSSAARVRAWELLGKTRGMFTDRTQVEPRPSFADELEALQPRIRQAIQDHKNSGVTLYEVNGLRKSDEADDE